MAYMQDLSWPVMPFYGTNMKLPTTDVSSSLEHVCTEPGCDLCFEDAQSLKDHMTQHTWGPHSIQTGLDGSKTFVCLNCGKGVTDRKVLRKHLLTHQEKRFLCSFDGCDKKFYERAKLKRHMLVHTGEKSFICTFDGCGKQFAYKANLKTHLRTHTGLKPFACMVPGCNRTFAQASNRNSHMQTHNRSSNGPTPSSFGKKDRTEWTDPKDIHTFMDQMDSVMNAPLPISSLNGYKIPTVPVMPLPLHEFVDGVDDIYHRIPTPPFAREKSVGFRKVQGNTVEPLDLSMDALKSSDLYSMLPTPGSFIGNSVFTFEA